MEHVVLHKRDGSYVPWPQPAKLPDGRLTVGITESPASQHPAVGLLGDWTVLESRDEGRTWSATDDPSAPQSWPGATTREKEDRFAAVMPDGSYLCAGATAWELWPVERLRDANERLGRYAKVGVTVDGEGKVLVGGQKLFAQRSTDGGKMWCRREWTVPGFRYLLSFSRGTQLADGTVLVPVYGTDTSGEDGWHDRDERTYVWRSADAGVTWRLHPLGTGARGVHDNETAFLEVSPGRVMAMSRTQPKDHDEAYMVQRWSEDGGVTWSLPLSTDIWGYPPHLLALRDGRILCTYGYRKDPMGVRAAFSHDGGESWDTDNTVVLRSDGGTASQLNPNPAGGAADVGYPISVELDGGGVFTAYYITLSDGVTHSAATIWQP